MADERPSDDRAASPNGDIIRLRGLHKSFGSLVVLDGVNLNVKSGENLVIIGPSGSGKSVILKHIVGLLKPDSGEVFFHDDRVDRMTERQLETGIRQRIGFVFQMGALFDSLTVGQNVAYPLEEHTRKTKGEIHDIVCERLALVGLSNTDKKMPGDLSGGQRKRVALARAIALEPEVILYDEPTTGLDPIRSDVINELILKLKEELHATGIVVTHDMVSAYKVSDRMVMLLNGKIAAEGTAEDIRGSRDENVQRFIHGRASEEELKAVRRM